MPIPNIDPKYQKGQQWSYPKKQPYKEKKHGGKKLFFWSAVFYFAALMRYTMRQYDATSLHSVDSGERAFMYAFIATVLLLTAIIARSVPTDRSSKEGLIALGKLKGRLLIAGFVLLALGVILVLSLDHIYSDALCFSALGAFAGALVCLFSAVAI